MRVADGLAELGGDPREAVGDGVFERLGLDVDLVPTHAELLDEQGLQQPVASHDGERERRPAGVSRTPR